jgi:hypothetical protein
LKNNDLADTVCLLQRNNIKFLFLLLVAIAYAKMQWLKSMTTTEVETAFSLLVLVRIKKCANVNGVETGPRNYDRTSDDNPATYR